MSTRIGRAIQRNQMLFVAVFSTSLCLGIGAHSAVNSRRQLARTELRMASQAMVMQGDMPSPSAMRQPTEFRFPGQGQNTVRNYYYVGEGNGSFRRVIIQTQDPAVILESNVPNPDYSSGVVTAQPSPGPVAPNGIGFLAFIGWTMGATLLAAFSALAADWKLAPTD